MSKWQNTTVFLTGASSGIGEGLAVALARKGATLGLLARRQELLNDLAERCERAGGTARVFPADVTDSAAVNRAADGFGNEFSTIDVLIANAGIGGNDQATRGYQPDAIRKVIDVNLLGAVNALHAVLPKMLEVGHGQLVAISSLAGFR